MSTRDVEVEEIGPADDDEGGVEAFRPKVKSETSRKLMAMKSGGVLRPIVPDGPDQLYTLAKMIYASGLQPKEMKTPEMVAVAIMAGAEIGLMPMQSLQGIAVINGRPSIWGAVAMAIVRRSGQMESIKEWLEIIPVFKQEITDKNGEVKTILREERIAHCVVKRVDEEAVESTFSISDAMKAGLWGKSQTPWQTYPDRMLKMRARAFAFRDVFPDVLSGLYLREEAQDMEPIDITPATVVERSGLAARLPGEAATGGFRDAAVEAEVQSAEPNLKDALEESLRADAE